MLTIRRDSRESWRIVSCKVESSLGKSNRVRLGIASIGNNNSHPFQSMPYAYRVRQ